MRTMTGEGGGGGCTVDCPENVKLRSCGPGPTLKNASTRNVDKKNEEMLTMRKWQCLICGLTYDEAEGWPDDGIEPGTRWEDVPDDWACPDCGASKADFEMVEV